MRRIIEFFRPAQPQVRPWHLTPEQHRQVLELLSEIGLGIVAESRGPVPLLTFGRRVLERLHAQSPTQPVPLAHFADALKRVISEMHHDQLRVMSPTDFIGVGYVYNAQDPDTYPFRSGYV